MITEPDEDVPRRKRSLEYGIVGSMLVHLLIALFYFQGQALLTRMHVRFPHPQPTEEAVTISSSITLDKRARPKIVPQPAQPKPQQPQPRRPQSQPNPATVAQMPKFEQPSIPVPSKLRHELSKNVPAAAPIPPKTQHEKQVTDTPTAPPIHTPQTPGPESRVALQQRTKAQQQAAQIRRNPSQPSQFSEQQIEKIQSELSQTIAQARSETNPLRVPPQPATAPKHYGLQMQAAVGNLRGYQGLCDPLRDPWQSNGYNYYYVACNVQFSDGLFERQAVPWPVRFRPNQDPFNGSMSPAQVQRMPLPGPEPDYKLPAGTPVSKELRKYAHDRGVDI
jgi:hypothetical protein